MVSRWASAIVLVSLAGVFGCAGSRASARPATSDVQSTLAAIRRENRNKLRDLENQIVVLEDRLHTAQRADSESLELPVEVRAPDTGAAEEDVLGDPASYEDGVEIVYVDEAAADHSVTLTAPPSRRPAAPPVREPARSARAGDDSDDSDASLDRALDNAVALGPSERIPVTDRVGPTVARQMQEARPPRSSAPAATTGPRALAASDDTSLADSDTLSPPATRQARPVTPERSRVRPRAQGKARSEDAHATAKGLYQKAYDALRAGDHAAAIAGFQTLLARYPGDDYADNARYWLGEAFYDQRDYRAALAEFEKVVRDYPDGNKVPDALLKMAYSYLALGDTEQARTTLVDIIEHHPDSGPARLAAHRLDTLPN